MNKMTIAIVVALTVTSSHAAFAGSSQHSQRIARENMEYFQAKGVKDSGQPVAQNPDYNFIATPAQRMAASSASYFKNKPSTGKTAAGANEADYVFNATPAQRMAARSYSHFNK